MCYFKENLKCMINWSEERTIDRNYCGSCSNNPSTGSCNGNCFAVGARNHIENRVSHCLDMIRRIPKQIKELKEKELDYKGELTVRQKN